MNALSDFLQIILTHAPIRWLVCVLIFVAFLQALRLISASWSALIAVIRRLAVPVWSLKFWIKSAVGGTLIFIFADQITAWMQWAEDMANPVYLSTTTAVTPDHAVALYEARIRQHCDSYEAAIVIRRTAETAAKINSTPLAIYESALLECGLNPFRVRDDRVAAGWIQFTRIGCHGLGVTMPQVIAACQRRDIVFIMDLTERYLIRKWENAGRPDMRNTIDLYLAIFSPANIGAQPDKVIYAGFSNPAYYKNSGLDGWCRDGDRIMRGAKDGRITGWEIWLCLERKKGMLLKSKI